MSRMQAEQYAPAAAEPSGATVDKDAIPGQAQPDEPADAEVAPG